jgi:alkyl sulfatase BDS1-like metallo-beta-lactamase superfamily hydrolase
MNFDAAYEETIKMIGKDMALTTDVWKIERAAGVSGPSGMVITDEGLVVVDTGMPQEGRDRVRRIREHTQAPFHTIIYSHGHGDHTGGAFALIEDNEKRGYPRPRIIGHKNVAKRFDKYRALAGRRRYINSLQFPEPETLPGPPARSEERPRYGNIYPDTTFETTMEFKLGGITFQIFHAPAETDDTLWVWVPERKLAMIGDLLVRGCPNTGNPLKEQRYTLEWAQALESIIDKKPDYVIGDPGALRGTDAIRICRQTADFLYYIQNEVVRLLNEGKWIEEILDSIKIPAEFTDNPWLTGSYGHPVFVIHDVYRRYTGWYDGNPSELFPLKSSDVAAEIIALTKPEAIMDRVKELEHTGDLQLALHLNDFVMKGSKNDVLRKQAMLIKAELLEKRARQVNNYIAGNIMRVSAGLLRKSVN